MEQPTLLPRLIGICGLAGTGKDTAANFLRSRYGFHTYSLATPIKRALNAMYGWNEEQWLNRNWKEEVQWPPGASPRQLAQTLGTEWGREVISPDIWIDFAARVWHYQKAQTDLGDTPARMVIPDVRFDNEAEWIVENGGLVVQITRREVEPVAAHPSECGLSEDWDRVYVRNDGGIVEFLQGFRAVLSDTAALSTQRYLYDRKLLVDWMD